ncbi:MAG: hypothetical protein HY902_20305, partial [Deltaproteobacteria bacterium]|nr:hypothetical protein [Deltaproteobacteria bacterium]
MRHPMSPVGFSTKVRAATKWCAATLLLALLAVGCASNEAKSTAPGDSGATADSHSDLGAIDGASDGKWGDTAQLPGMPTDVHIDLLPAGQQQMTAEQHSHAVEKLKAGGEFVDLHMRPGVVSAPPSVLDTVVVAPDQLTLPKAGNEALLKLPVGAPFVGGPSANNPANPFGFLRKVKSVHEVDGQIVVATERAHIGDIMIGALAMKIDADDLQVVDTTGVDEGMFFANWEGKLVPTSPTRRAWQRWARFRAPLKEKDIDIAYTGDWSFQGSFDALTLDVNKTIGNVNLSLSGTAKGTANFSFKPSFYLQIGIDFLDFEYLNVGASGQLDLAAAVDLDMTLAAALGTDKEAEKGAIDSLTKNPGPANKKKLELVELGPFAGPIIPTTPPIPTFFKILVTADCSISVYGTITTHLEGGVSTGAGFGVSWEEGDSCSSSSDCWTSCNAGKCGNGWQTTTNANFSQWHNASLALGGGLTAECGLQPEIQWLIADIAGPTAAVRGAVKGTLAATSTCPAPDTLSAAQSPDLATSLTFDVGVQALVGGAIDFFIPGFGIDFEFTIWEYWWTIWQKVWDFPQGGFGWCQAACSDGVKDYAEGDIDCGGLCATLCAEGKTCKTGADCATYNCSNGKCGPPLCIDKLKDGTETDVDCGGYCPVKCGSGQGCNSHADCGKDASGAALGCNSLTQKCALPPCS